MSTLKCSQCLNLKQKQILKVESQCLGVQNDFNSKNLNKQIELAEKTASKVTLNLQSQSNVSQNNLAGDIILFHCTNCDKYFCKNCCLDHIDEKNNLKRQEKDQLGTAICDKNSQIQQDQESQLKKCLIGAKIVCQQCEQQNSIKYCPSCEQFLCESCSFKIHNKGKRIKHKLNSINPSILKIKTVVILAFDFSIFLNEFYVKKHSKTFAELFQAYFLEEMKLNFQQNMFLIQQTLDSETLKLDKLIIKNFSSQILSQEQFISLTNEYPFIKYVKIILGSKESQIFDNLIKSKQIENKMFEIQIIEEYKKLQKYRGEKEQQKNILKHHNKNISNFSNFSAISKIQNQSILSNQNSQISQLSLNITLNQNYSVLMGGALSDRDKNEEKQQIKKNEIKQQRQSHQTHHRIYSIRQQTSHHEANNLSTSTQNSIRKRNKKGPIPYFQPFRVSKNDKTMRYNAQIYLRELAEKGILMIRKQKAQKYLFDNQISRQFVRNIGQKQIEYISYIIEFISIECLSWVIQSIKQDKMTPNEKLILSRIKQSFDLKINIKLWESIIKYLQSNQYEVDYLQNTKNRYVPKISVVKYGEQFLLQFQERRWQYEDQDLLDEDQQEWKQFKKLIIQYFDGHTQITGGRYGCVQYVKLNGPKPLRSCSLGKLSMYVQEAINKGLIRYHKTLLVSNSQNNSSTSQVNSNLTSITVQSAINLTQMQKQIKISTIQIVLIDMFMEVGPHTPISLAQIPLNLKKNILFDINLVELGFPKLKNMLNTLSDKLILQTTKTHITYEVTSNGCQNIQKHRTKLMQLNKKVLQQLLNTVGLLINNYHSISLESLYNQINYKYNFVFDYKIFNMPDFYQFTIYYCSHLLNVQFYDGIFVAYNKYSPYTNQNYSINLNQEKVLHPLSYNYTYGNCNEIGANNNFGSIKQNFNSFQSLSYQNKEKKYQKELQINTNYSAQSFSSSIKTPKFNSSIQYQQNSPDKINWQYYGDIVKKDDDFDESFNDEQSSKSIEQIVNNILDEQNISESRSKISYPKTVIEKECSSITNQLNNELFILQKATSINEKESFEDEQNFQYFNNPQNQEAQKVNDNVKWQHIRVKSTNEARVKHQRMYSTTIPRK